MIKVKQLVTACLLGYFSVGAYAAKQTIRLHLTSSDTNPMHQEDIAHAMANTCFTSTDPVDSQHCGDKASTYYSHDPVKWILTSNQQHVRDCFYQTQQSHEGYGTLHIYAEVNINPLFPSLVKCRALWQPIAW